MKVLVTGGGGFLGRYIVRDLLDRGDEVRIVARSDYSDLRDRGVETIRGDIADSAAMHSAVEGVDAVIHVAGQPGVWGTRDFYWAPNVVGTRNVIAACREHGVRRLVYTSSPSVVFDAAKPHDGVDESVPYPERYLCHYPASKAEAERAVLAAHEPGRLHTVALRPHLIWGPGDRYLIPRLIEAARGGRVARVGDGKNRASVVYVENAASAHLAALDAIASPTATAGGCVYFVAQAEPVELWTFIDRILVGVGAPPIHRTMSFRTAWRIGAFFEGVYRVLRLPGEPRMTRFVAAQLAIDHWFCIDAASRDLGWRPAISTDEGLTRLFAAHRTALEERSADASVGGSASSARRHA